MQDAVGVGSQWRKVSIIGANRDQIRLVIVFYNPMLSARSGLSRFVFVDLIVMVSHRFFCDHFDFIFVHLFR